MTRHWDHIPRASTWPGGTLAILICLLSATTLFAGQTTPAAGSLPEDPSRPATVGRASSAPAPAQGRSGRGRAATPPAAEAPVTPIAPDDDTLEPRWVNVGDVVRVGQDYTVRAGDVVSDAVVIGGNLVVEGEVRGDAVVVMGSLTLGPKARVNGEMVVVGASANVADGAVVRGELVVVGGTLNAPAGFSAGQQHVVVGSDGLGAFFNGFWPWFSRGPMLGRLVVPSLPWMWGLVAVIAFVVLVVGTLLERAVHSTAVPLATRPLSTFLAGLLVMLLTPLVLFLLAVSVVGIIVIPFAICALIVASVLGKIAVARSIGAAILSEDESANKMLAARSTAIGLVILVVALAIPILGLPVYMLVSVFGMGAATMALFAGLRRENPSRPKPPRPVPPVPTEPPPVSPPPYGGTTTGEGYAGGANPAGASVSAFSTAGSGGPSTFDNGPAAYATAGGAPVGQMDTAVLLSMPKAQFGERAAAFALDVILVGITVGILDLSPDGPRTYFLLLVVYHVIFWTVKGTTVGGIICNLRVVRTDGRPVSFGDATVRGLTSVLSLACLGLGALWILRDPERQAWHDRFAGTYVVKVPKNWH